MITLFLNKKKDFSLPNEIDLYARCIRQIFYIICNRKPSKIIQDLDAFKILLSLISSSSQFNVIKECLKMIDYILKSNPNNILIFLDQYGLNDLQILFCRIVLVEGSIEELIKTRFFNFIGNSKYTPIVKFILKRNDSKEEENTFEAACINEQEASILIDLLEKIICSITSTLAKFPVFPDICFY